MASYTEERFDLSRHRDRRADRGRRASRSSSSTAPARSPASTRCCRWPSASGSSSPSIPASAPRPTTRRSTTSTTTRRHYLDLFDELGHRASSRWPGHSMGGWLAANFAADHSERVTRLVLAAPLGPAGRRAPDDGHLRDPRRGAARLPDRGHVDLRGRTCRCRRRPEFLADRYRETTSAARLMWDAALRPQAAPLAAPADDADAAALGRGRPRSSRSSRRRCGPSSSRAPRSRRCPASATSCSTRPRGGRRGRQLRGRGADGLRTLPPRCALRAHLCASWHGEGTVSAP